MYIIEESYLQTFSHSLNFAQPQKRMNLKTVFYRGRKYYKISLSDKESIMIPYKPNITDEEVLSYIERYRNP